MRMNSILSAKGPVHTKSILLFERKQRESLLLVDYKISRIWAEDTITQQKIE